MLIVARRNFRRWFVPEENFHQLHIPGYEPFRGVGCRCYIRVFWPGGLFTAVPPIAGDIFSLPTKGEGTGTDSLVAVFLLSLLGASYLTGISCVRPALECALCTF